MGSFKQNADLFAARGAPVYRRRGVTKYCTYLFEDVQLADLTAYQLGTRFVVDRCVSITVQVSFCGNACIVALRDSAVGPNTYAAALSNPKGMELSNGLSASLEATTDPETGDYEYLIAQNYWLMCVRSYLANGGSAHVIYGVIS